LRRNKRLDRFFIRDFNKDPNSWAEKDDTFDAVVCCVSVQYMQQPERVFAEVHRVLKPGGVCIMTFSSRLFYEKAIQGWRDNSAYGRVSLVKQYFQCIKGMFCCLKQCTLAALPPNAVSRVFVTDMVKPFVCSWRHTLYRLHRGKGGDRGGPPLTVAQWLGISTS